MTTTTRTGSVDPTGRRRPLIALATAEFRQFCRNKTLVTMGTLFPIGIPLATLFIARREGDVTATVAATTLELFAYAALLFVQYYSVLSMVTTRRGEGVLKRLRTGEAADWQILTAPAAPGIALTALGAAVVAGVVYGFGAPAPVNPILIAVALIAGVVLFSVLALATSAVTKNAEAAQITSLPVMVLATIGLGSIRSILPDGLATLAGWTPFAAISDLVSLGATGKTVMASSTDAALDFAGTFGEIAQPLATLVLWSALAFALTSTSFRWDDRG